MKKLCCFYYSKKKNNIRPKRVTNTSSFDKSENNAKDQEIITNKNFKSECNVQYKMKENSKEKSEESQEEIVFSKLTALGSNNNDFQISNQIKFRNEENPNVENFKNMFQDQSSIEYIEEDISYSQGSNEEKEEDEQNERNSPLEIQYEEIRNSENEDLPIKEILKNDKEGIHITDMDFLDIQL